MPVRLIHTTKDSDCSTAPSFQSHVLSDVPALGMRLTLDHRSWIPLWVCVSLPLLFFILILQVFP